MYIQFICGRLGTGKTRQCLQMIKEKLDGDTPLYYLIPEQYSLQAEKLLLTLDRRVITRVQALSFNRLAYRVFSKMGGPPGKLLDDVGKGLLLRKILFECGDQLTFYKNTADKQGFVDNLAAIITEFNHHNVTAEDLRVRMPESTPVLKNKLNDLSLVLEKYRSSVRERYLLTDDILDVLCKRLENNDMLQGSCFWVDGFYGFTPQEYRVLSLIMQASEKTIVTVTMNEQVTDTLTRLAKQSGIPIKPPIILTDNYRHARSPALDYFCTHIETKETFAGIQNNIAITHAADKYACVYEAARLVRQWVHEKGYRYRDIAILCGDRANYDHILQTAFDRCRIPLFADNVTGILSHPLTELIRSALDIVLRDWSYISVFRFLKTRLAGLSLSEVDILENYVLARGIKGYRWRYPFNDEKAEAPRLKLLDMLSLFDKLRSTSTDTMRGFSTRVFEMLHHLQVPNTLVSWFTERMEAGDANTARLHKQIWPKICEVFDKLVEILGDEKVNLRTYARILDAGLAQADLGRIPPTTDQVFLGDISRSRFPRIKALIVLGANDNVLPPAPRDDGLLTDHERLALRNTALELAPDNARQWNESFYALYCALCQPCDELIFIYADAEPGGSKPLRPAAMLKRLTGMFPSLTAIPSPAYTEYGPVPAVPVQQFSLSPETVKRLYGPNVVTAASRLEQYAACPFAYFVTYNLKAKERKIYQVRHMDLGVLFHEVLLLFSTEITEEGISWGKLTREEIAERAGRHVERFISETDDHVLRSTARNRHVLEKAKRICVTSLWALNEHVKRGSFIPAGAELAFTPQSPLTSLEVLLNNKRRLILTGRIDRVDIYDAHDGCRYVKIIDYKSGKKKFELSEVLLGTQLQLVLYMNVLLKNAAQLFGDNAARIETRPGGVFYFHIDDPVIAADNWMEAEEREALLLKAFRMSGLALAEPEAVTGMDEKLRNGGDSLIIPVSINKSGAFGKSSSVAGLEEFEQLGRDAEEKIKEIGQRMTGGDIKPEPVVKGRNSECDYCRYGGICGAGVLK
jgi:ATP-dependent helicase/nuclease subunit B